MVKNDVDNRSLFCFGDHYLMLQFDLYPVTDDVVGSTPTDKFTIIKYAGKMYNYREVIETQEMYKDEYGDIDEDEDIDEYFLEYYDCKAVLKSTVNGQENSEQILDSLLSLQFFLGHSHTN